MPRGPFGREKVHRFEQSRNLDLEAGGIIRISGSFLLDHEEDIVSLVKHQGKQASEKNPGHKVTRIDKTNGGITVETSDHNLAMKIGKALCRAYKGEHQYKFREGEKFVEVDWRRD